jgi:hypothetical protein
MNGAAIAFTAKANGSFFNNCDPCRKVNREGKSTNFFALHLQSQFSNDYSRVSPTSFVGDIERDFRYYFI